MMSVQESECCFGKLLRDYFFDCVAEAAAEAGLNLAEDVYVGVIRALLEATQDAINMLQDNREEVAWRKDPQSGYLDEEEEPLE